MPIRSCAQPKRESESLCESFRLELPLSQQQGMKPSTSAQAQNRLVCLVCRKQFSQYTCPRCNLRYCSLLCYRSHSARCLESFNRDNVLANMQDCVATPNTRKRMMETLKRFYSDDAMDEDHNGMHADDGSDDDDDALERGSCVLSQNTLNKLASGEDIRPSDLSPEEKKAFLRAVASGDFSRMIKPWKPWWLSPFVKKIALNKEGNRAVQPVESTDAMHDNGNEIFDVPPPLDSPLPPLKQLTSKPPSPLLGVHLAEVLYSYCFTLRFYNGDWICDAFDAAWTCLSVSHVLRQSASPQTIGEALSSCFEIVCSPLFKSAGGYKFALALLDDVAALLNVGRAGGICALSELHRLLDKAAKDTKQGDGNTIHKGPLKLDLSRKPVKTKASTCSDLKKACKKVFFLLCWTNEQPAEIFSSLALLIETEKACIVETCEPSVLESNNRRWSDTSNDRKAFVEEIN